MTDTTQPREQAVSGSSHDVVIALREYAGNPGYSHNDYADTMRQAAQALIAAFDDPKCSIASVNNYVRDLERALGRTAGTAPEAWRPIKTAPTNMARHLYLVDGFCVQGFVDATGELMVQSEVSPHWRKMRGKPTHWMPIPAAPSPQENTK